MPSTDNSHSDHGRLLRRLLAVTAVLATMALPAPTCGSTALNFGPDTAVRAWTIQYTAHDGARRSATVILPASYGPHNNPSIPLVISPHGRNGTGRANAQYWGKLPAAGGFAVVNPDGMGRRLKSNSFGYTGQIDDLARMPELVRAALPWVRIDRQRIYALGSSMGGQETLLLVARHPNLLAGAAAMDSVTDLVRRYRQLPQIAGGRNLQSMMRKEVGGTPGQKPKAYEARSPLDLADSIAQSDVPLQIWWSKVDRIVIDQKHQSAALFRLIQRLHPRAEVKAYVGYWRHSSEMRSTSLLPLALIDFGLLPRSFQECPAAVQQVVYSA